MLSCREAVGLGAGSIASANGLVGSRQVSTRSASPSRERVRFALDSPLEGSGFELLVPPSKRTAVSELAPSFFARPAAPAAIVLVSENDDFELPASHSSLAHRATVRRPGWKS